MKTDQRSLRYPKPTTTPTDDPMTPPRASNAVPGLTWRFTFRAPAGEPESRNIQRFRLLLKHALRTRQLKCIGVETMTMGPCGQVVPK